MRKNKNISFLPEYQFVLDYLNTLKNASRYLIDLVIADMEKKGLIK